MLHIPGVAFGNRYHKSCSSLGKPTGASSLKGSGLRHLPYPSSIFPWCFWVPSLNAPQPYISPRQLSKIHLVNNPLVLTMGSAGDALLKMSYYYCLRWKPSFFSSLSSTIRGAPRNWIKTIKKPYGVPTRSLKVWQWKCWIRSWMS